MKILFFDLDGTLMPPGGITAECLAELSRVRALGHKVVLNTGRSLAFLPPEVRALSLFDGRICGSAYIEYGGEILNNTVLSRATLEKAVRFAREAGTHTVIFEGVDECFSTRPGTFLSAEESLLCDRLPEITKLTFWGDPTLVPDALFPELHILHLPHYAEGIQRGFDKSTGMALILKKEGLTPADAFAFGDSGNDLAMLRFAGHPVVMKEAPAEFDAFACYRAKSADGVTEALRKFF